MVLFGLAFGLLEIAFIVIAVIALLVGVALDRAEESIGAKWWITGIFLVAGFALFVPSGTGFAGIWAFLSSEALWKPVGIYAAIGLGYSVVEFVLSVRRTNKKYAEDWKNYLSRARAGGRESNVDIARAFCSERYTKRGFITVDAKGSNIDPTIDRLKLSGYIGAWIFWWPFYLINTVLGDLIVHIFEFLADVFANFGGRFVRFVFRDTFKFSE